MPRRALTRSNYRVAKRFRFDDLPGRQMFYIFDKAGAAKSFDYSPSHMLDMTAKDTIAGIVVSQENLHAAGYNFGMKLLYVTMEMQYRNQDTARALCKAEIRHKQLAGMTNGYTKS